MFSNNSISGIVSRSSSDGLIHCQLEKRELVYVCGNICSSFLFLLVYSSLIREFKYEKTLTEANRVRLCVEKDPQMETGSYIGWPHPRTERVFLHTWTNQKEFGRFSPGASFVFQHCLLPCSRLSLSYFPCRANVFYFDFLLFGRRGQIRNLHARRPWRPSEFSLLIILTMVVVCAGKRREKKKNK